jgi:uncharacterized protein (TIGR02453 family)
MQKNIDQSFIDFFIELAQNNHKDWFDKNRSRYQTYVKEPFTNLVSEIIIELKEKESLNNLETKDCIFRINKDVRFSKDKQPYKLQMGASICKNGKKDMSYPGLYFEIGPEYLNIYSGVYMPDKNQLENIRNCIFNNNDAFLKIISDKKFIKHFGTIKGEKNKVIAQHLKTFALTQPLIYNKQFYVIHQIDINKVINKNIKNYILEVYESVATLNEFFRKAI